MIFEVLKWDGTAWIRAGLLVAGKDKTEAWETLYWLGVCERGSTTHALRCAQGI